LRFDDFSLQNYKKKLIHANKSIKIRKNDVKFAYLKKKQYLCGCKGVGGKAKWLNDPNCQNGK